MRQQQATAPKAVASDRDLDGRYGDPVLKFNPRDWSGPSFKDRRFSECPPALLDMAAETLEWFGKQADEKDERTNSGKPVGDYKRQDAARARGWAKRLRAAGATNGHGASQPDAGDEFGADSDFGDEGDSFS